MIRCPSRAPQRILRTASHYIQNGVDQCLSDTKGRFLFSALPFRSDNKRMLSAIHYALEYSDPSILDEVHHAAANHNTDGVGEKGEALKRERLDFAKTYVELILRLSREPLAANPPQLEPHPPMTEFLSRVLARCEAAQPPQAFSLLASAVPRCTSSWAALAHSTGAGSTEPAQRLVRCSSYSPGQRVGCFLAVHGRGHCGSVL